MDASHEKFRGLYLDVVAEELKKAGRDKIDYIIVSHTEPDHSGLITDLVDIYPDVVVAGSKVCVVTCVPWACVSFVVFCVVVSLDHSRL